MSLELDSPKACPLEPLLPPLRGAAFFVRRRRGDLLTLSTDLSRGRLGRASKSPRVSRQLAASWVNHCRGKSVSRIGDHRPGPEGRGGTSG